MDHDAQHRAPLLRQAVTWAWKPIAALLVVASWSIALGMLIAGTAGYQSDSYQLIREVPGGMRTYGALLSLLLGYIAYGYGQARAGRCTALRAGMSLLSAWYMVWITLIVVTYVEHWTVYSWNALVLNSFTAAVAVLVARSVPASGWR